MPTIPPPSHPGPGPTCQPTMLRRATPRLQHPRLRSTGHAAGPRKPRHCSGGSAPHGAGGPSGDLHGGTLGSANPHAAATRHEVKPCKPVSFPGWEDHYGTGSLNHANLTQVDCKPTCTMCNGAYKLVADGAKPSAMMFLADGWRHLKGICHGPWACPKKVSAQ